MEESRGVRVEVYCGETDRVGHRPRYQVMLEYLRAEGAAGATVSRGIAGFGHNSRIHTSSILRLSEDLPLILTWIDAPERVDRLLPGLRQLAGSGVITVQEVGIAGYGERRLQQLRFDLPVRDVMVHPPLSVTADTPLGVAVEMLIGRDFRALPVTDAAGRLVGMLSNTDLVERAGLQARLELLAVLPDAERTRVLEALPGRQVGQVMRADPVSIVAGETLAVATRLMSDRRLKRMPVVDEAGRPVGILARGDVLRAVGETFPRVTAMAVEHPGAATVGEVMRPEAPSVRADADLAQLLDAVASTRLNRAVVVDDEERVLGILSDADVVRALGDALPEGLLGALMGGERRPRSDRRAADLLRGPADTLTRDTSLADAARVAMQRRRKVLPVTDEGGRLLGIVDRADLLHASRGALDALAEGGADDG